MGQKERTDPSLLAAGANVGVPDESDIANLLKAHNACERSGVFIAPEHNTFIDFVLQFAVGHIGFCPAIVRDDSFVGTGAVVDDGPNTFEVLVRANADHVRPVAPAGVLSCCAGFCRRAATKPPAAPPKIFRPCATR